MQLNNSCTCGVWRGPLAELALLPGGCNAAARRWDGLGCVCGRRCCGRRQLVLRLFWLAFPAGGAVVVRVLLLPVGHLLQLAHKEACASIQAIVAPAHKPPDRQVFRLAGIFEASHFPGDAMRPAAGMQGSSRQAGENASFWMLWIVHWVSPGS